MDVSSLRQPSDSLSDEEGHCLMTMYTRYYMYSLDKRHGFNFSGFLYNSTLDG